MTLLELFQLLKKHLKLVITLPVVCAIAMGIVSFVAMDNTYTATTSMYILAKTDDSGQMSYNDLSASQMLSNDIATLLDSDSVKSGAAKELASPIWMTTRCLFPPRPPRVSLRFRLPAPMPRRRLRSQRPWPAR